jgi:hypothetical protein
VQLIQSTSESNIGDAAAITRTFNFLKGFNKSEANAVGGAQNLGFYALLTAVNQSEISTGDAVGNVFSHVAGGKSTATGRVKTKNCNMRCLFFLIKPVCYLHSCN